MLFIISRHLPNINFLIPVRSETWIQRLLPVNGDLMEILCMQKEDAEQHDASVNH